MRCWTKSWRKFLLAEGMEITHVIIPARAGSKRLVGKNKMLIAGKPLFEWTLNAALELFHPDHISVSTDDDDIIRISAQKGLDVEGKRPDYLCTDVSSTRDVVMYELDKKNIDKGNVLILQPTSPLRQSKHILESFSLYAEKKAFGVVSVCECDHPYEWINYLAENESMKDFLKVSQNSRSQDFKPAYRLNGAIYLYDVAQYLKNENLINNAKTFAYKMDKAVSIDIDDYFDFQVAELFLWEKNA